MVNPLAEPQVLKGVVTYTRPLYIFQGRIINPLPTYSLLNKGLQRKVFRDKNTVYL